MGKEPAKVMSASPCVGFCWPDQFLGSRFGKGIIERDWGEESLVGGLWTHISQLRHSVSSPFPDPYCPGWMASFLRPLGKL